MTKKKMTHASVFSGIGGAEVAATMLGWENLFHCEINPFGRRVLEYWYPKSKSYEDITKTNFSEWRGKVSVLSGGFPCQPFSVAGQRRGKDDDRYLWPHMLRVIDEVRPTWFVGENVVGILSMVEQGEVVGVEDEATLFGEVDNVRRYRQRSTFTIERICRDLEGHGYSVQAFVIPACAVGAPHRRDRVFIVGHRDSPDTESEQGDRCGLEQPEDCGKEQIELGGGNSTDGVRWLSPDTSIKGLEGAASQRVEGHDRRVERCEFCIPLRCGGEDDVAGGGCGIHSRLNPQFTEEMMGFPSMWVACPFLLESGAPRV